MAQYQSFTILQKEEDFNQYLHGFPHVILFFNSSTCGPCINLKPNLNSAILSSRKLVNAINNRQLCILSIEINAFEKLTETYAVNAVPCLYYFIPHNINKIELPRNAQEIVNYLEKNFV